MPTITSHQKNYNNASSNGANISELTKPRVVALLLLTAVVGMVWRRRMRCPFGLLIPALTGIGLMSAAAAAINHLVDRHIDAKMARTLRRPLPQGNLSPFNACIDLCHDHRVTGFCHAVRLGQCT